MRIGKTREGKIDRRCNTPAENRETEARALIWWMLHECGYSYAAIARAAGRSQTIVSRWCKWYERHLEHQIKEPKENSAEPFLRRLIEAFWEKSAF
jgi:DNA invertase Pin-like site-specific DNA recombinase